MAQKKRRTTKHGWGFSLPPLPKDCYMKLQTMCADLNLTQWQTFILCVAVTSQYAREDLAEYVKMVQTTYPAPWSAPQVDQGD